MSHKKSIYLGIMNVHVVYYNDSRTILGAKFHNIKSMDNVYLTNDINEIISKYKNLW